MITLFGWVGDGWWFTGNVSTLATNSLVNSNNWKVIDYLVNYNGQDLLNIRKTLPERK